MCGIAGLFGFQNQTINLNDLEVMNREIIHRGPDADGFYTYRHIGLCMRRLKVIDLTTGNQPISNEDKTLWIVFNGEIYNFKELRESLIKKGHKFHTSSDTEVIVHLYQEYREACVSHLIGMFAFAIYDTVRDEVFIARDRLGIKPLFYYESHHGIAFASEIKPVIKSPWMTKELDPQAISHFLSLNYLPSPWTPFKGIRQLPQGHWMKISKSGIETRQYWDIPHGETIEVSEQEACKTILSLLHRSMERRLIADVPIGTFLSGGLDSSALVWLMKEHRHDRIKTFSAGFDHPDYDETPYARTVSKYFGTEHHEIHCTADDVVKLLPRLAWHADNLLADQAALPLYLVSKLAKEHVTVCLSGDGGDEVFVGYPTFHADHYHAIYRNIPKSVRRFVIEPIIRALPGSERKLSFEYKSKKFIEAADYGSEKAHYWWRTIYTDEEKKKLAGEFLSHTEMDTFPLYEAPFREAGASKDVVNRALYADMKVWLGGNNLYKVDTMSMAHGLEARVPFLDHELVEYMSRLPSHLKFKSRILKYLMKRVLKGKLPESIYHRKKAGFHSPVAYWFREQLQPHLRETLLPKSKVFSSIIRQTVVEQLIDNHRAGCANNAYRLWGLLVLRSWVKLFFEND